MSNINTGTSNIPIPDNAYTRWRRSAELCCHTAWQQVQPKHLTVPTDEQARQNKEAVILVTLLAALDYFILDLIEETVAAGLYKHANKRNINRARDIIVDAHATFYRAMTKFNDKGIAQYNDAMDAFYAAINECVMLEAPERAYNIVVAMCRLQAQQDERLTYHTYPPSKVVAKIPKMLEGLGITDYHLDNIIDRKIRPIIMNSEYVEREESGADR